MRGGVKLTYPETIIRGQKPTRLLALGSRIPRSKHLLARARARVHTSICSGGCPSSPARQQSESPLPNLCSLLRTYPPGRWAMVKLKSRATPMTDRGPHLPPVAGHLHDRCGVTSETQVRGACCVVCRRSSLRHPTQPIELGRLVRYSGYLEDGEGRSRGEVPGRCCTGTCLSCW